MVGCEATVGAGSSSVSDWSANQENVMQRRRQRKAQICTKTKTKKRPNMHKDEDKEKTNMCKDEDKDKTE